MLPYPKLLGLTTVSCRMSRILINARYSSSHQDDNDEFDDPESAANIKVIFDASMTAMQAAANASNVDLLLEQESDGLNGKRYVNFPLPGYVTTGMEYRKFMVPKHSRTHSALGHFIKTRNAKTDEQKQMEIVEHFGAVNHIRNSLALKRRNSGKKPLSFLDSVNCMAHECPVLLKRDLCASFPELYSKIINRLTVITVTENAVLSEKEANAFSHQPTNFDKSDSILGHDSYQSSRFKVAAEGICDYLQASGYWADFIDPSSGKLFSAPANAPTRPLTTPNPDNVNNRLLANFNGVSVQEIAQCKVISQTPKKSNKILSTSLEQQSTDLSDHTNFEPPEKVGVVFTTAAVDSLVVKSLVQHIAPAKIDDNRSKTIIDDTAAKNNKELVTNETKKDLANPLFKII